MSKRVTRSSATAEKEAAKIGQHLDSEKEEAAALGRFTTRKDLKCHLMRYSDFTFITPQDKWNKELDMINLSGFIQEQSDWATKIQNKKQFSKLVREFGAFKDPSAKEEVIKSVVKKLNDYLAIKGEGSKINLGACDGTWQSDALINSPLRKQLLSNIRILEASIPEKQMDWNDKNEQVWNLLSPSMYPLVRERSKILKYLPSIQEEESNESLIHFHTEEDFLFTNEAAKVGFRYSGMGDVNKLSRRFQWLPSEFEIGEDNSVRIASYVNNLHPEVHSGLYSVIEEVFQEFIPLFEKVLTDLQKQKEKSKKKKDGELPDEISEFKLAGQTIQVITKFTNILLTPEKPTYPGGTFHIEGMLNERIVAAGIYYLDSDNITEQKLEFQVCVSPWWSSRLMYANVRSIVTKEGRCVAFPNYIQHRVTSFELKDKTKLGHRKILAFFLVDPSSRRVISTRHVPPQQKSWFVKEIMKGPICFPQEVVEMIVEKLDWPMGFKEAKRHRDELLEEKRPKPVQQIQRRYCAD